MPLQKNTRTTSEHEIIHVCTSDDLIHLCEKLASTSVLAVDTEFVRDKTYYPILCLIQVAADDIVACIDPITIQDLSPLRDLLFNSSITKVFHAARQDLEILYLTFGAIPTPVFDTQIAATLLGLGEQIGYANLVSHYLKMNIPKGQARADWEQRPLSAEQLEYAANDVRYLLQIYPVIKDALTSMGRITWLDDDFAELTREELYTTQPDQLWLRIAGQQKLRGIQLAVLQKLAAWRELTAQQKNKPKKWILPDDMLITMSMQMPEKKQQLTRIRGLNTGVIERNGDEILALISSARKIPESEWPRPSKRRKPDKQQEALIDAIMSIVKLQAAKHEISTGAIAGKSDLDKLAYGDRDVPLLHGWRLGVAGQQVIDFLDGKTGLHFENNELKLD